MFRIVRREETDEGIMILNEISAPTIAKKAKPGQLVLLKANDMTEIIQLPLAAIDRIKGTVTITYMVVCQSTAIFKSLQVGETFQGIIGPFVQAEFP